MVHVPTRGSRARSACSAVGCSIGASFRRGQAFLPRFDPGHAPRTHRAECRGPAGGYAESRMTRAQQPQQHRRPAHRARPGRDADRDGRPGRRDRLHAVPGLVGARPGRPPRPGAAEVRPDDPWRGRRLVGAHAARGRPGGGVPRSRRRAPRRAGRTTPTRRPGPTGSAPRSPCTPGTSPRRSTGRPPTWTPRWRSAVWPFMRASLTDDNRAPAFQAEQPAPDGADAYARAAAFAGRKV